MKNFLSAAICGLLLLIAPSCNNLNRNDDNRDRADSRTRKPNQSIIGKWEPIAMEGEDVTESEKRDIIRKATIEFTRDGRYYSVSPDERESGEYTYDKQERILTTTSESGRKEDLKVRWIKDKLEIEYRDGGARITLQRTDNREEEGDGEQGREENDGEDMGGPRSRESAISIAGKWRLLNSTEDLGNTGGKTIEFRRNGSYRATSEAEEDDYGSYTYNKIEGTLETVSDNGDKMDFEVEFRGKNKIILTYDKGKITLLRE